MQKPEGHLQCYNMGAGKWEVQPPTPPDAKRKPLIDLAVFLFPKNHCTGGQVRPFSRPRSNVHMNERKGAEGQRGSLTSLSDSSNHFTFQRGLEPGSTDQAPQAGQLRYVWKREELCQGKHPSCQADQQMSCFLQTLHPNPP